MSEHTHLLSEYIHQLLSEYIHQFLGYGNLDSDLWFIGLEEAGDIADIKKRLIHWEKRGKQVVESSPDFKRLIGDKKNYFGENNKIQSTLNKLIRLELAFRGNQAIDKEDVRAFQRSKWGTLKGSSAALELSALPRVKIKDTGYFSEDHASPFLRSHTEYKNFLKEHRTKTLSNAILRKKPKHVIMYGGGDFYQCCWETIERNAKNPNTKFKIIKHPQARPTSNEEFEKIGLSMRKR